jgi:hypothetical protein
VYRRSFEKGRKADASGNVNRRRSEALAKGNAFLAEGKTTQARDCFVKAVDVTPEMAYQFIKVHSRPPRAPCRFF